MGKDLERPVWRGQRPWFEVWFAVVIDESRRRALWVRQTMFVPREGPGRASVWGAWFDADATPQRRAAKRFAPLDLKAPDDTETLIATFDARLSRTSAVGSVDGLAWDVSWTGGRAAHPELPAWLPAPTHARAIIHDADARGTITSASGPIEIRGKALAMHLWGKRRVPTLHWIWAPWLGDASLEVTAASLRDTFALGVATLRLDGPHPLRGTPATAAHRDHLVTATVAGPRRRIHVQAWAEPEQCVGYAYRDTDGRDLMVSQSDIGSAAFEVYTRAAPGTPWRRTDERRVRGGVAVEIHQRDALPDVDYVPWDGTVQPVPVTKADPLDPESVAWPDVRAIVALGLTYADHVRETGRKLDPKAPPTAFTKHVRAFAPGAREVLVPEVDHVLAALDELEPGLGHHLRERVPFAPAVMDYEGEIALVVLGDVDPDALARGTAQPIGLAAANDLTSRLVQVLGEGTERQLEYWTRAKSFPGFLPTSPRVWAPPGGISRLPELPIETRVNGEVRQRATTKLVIYDLVTLLRAATAELGRPLAIGDVVLTGTPAGVGLRMSPLTRQVARLVKDRYRRAELLVSSHATSSSLLRPGDVVEVDAGRAGTVRTRLVV